MTQSRTSYLPREVLWGNRFANLISYDRTNDTYLADYDKCDELQQIDTPLCSARRLEEVLGEYHDFVGGKRQGDAHYYAAKTSYSSMRSSVDVQQQNSANTERVQFRHLERLAEELEYRLSNHSLHFDRASMTAIMITGDEIVDDDDIGVAQMRESKAWDIVILYNIVYANINMIVEFTSSEVYFKLVH